MTTTSTCCGKVSHVVWGSAILIGITVTMGPFFHLTMLAHVFWVPW